MGNNLDVQPVSRTLSSNSHAEFRSSINGSNLPVVSGTGWASQRRWKRYCVDMAVQVRVTTQGPTRIVASEGQGNDLSGGGLAVTVEMDLLIGSQIGVEFTPPYSDEPIVLRCFVRNRDGYRYGLEFITENDDDYQKTGDLQAGLAAMDSAPQS